MHVQGNPKTSRRAPNTDDVFAEVNRYSARQIAHCEKAGIGKDKVLSTRGSVFGSKSLPQVRITRSPVRIPSFRSAAVRRHARKSMIGQLLNVGPSERLSGSLACAVIAAMQGAHIIRVHDVKETVEAMRVVEATLSAKENKRYE
ncbi:dihydropteroate synthase [Shigella flexneri]